MSLLLLSGLCISHSWAQNRLIFRHLGKNNGLSQNAAFAIEQDSDGFMWIGTRNGLNKYNGYRFTQYEHDEKNPNSLIFNDIREVYFDKVANCVWVGTKNGLSQFLLSEDRFQNYQLNNSPDHICQESNFIYQVFRDTKHRLWLGTEGGFKLMDEESGTFQRILANQRADSGHLHTSIKSIYEDKAGNIWVGGKKGLFSVKARSDTSYFLHPATQDFPELAELSDLHIRTLLGSAEGNMWIGTHEHGLKFWDRRNQKLISYQHNELDETSISNNEIRSAAFDKEGKLWVGTFYGLNKFISEEEGFQRIYSNDFDTEGLSSNSIHSVFVDDKGGLWVGTYYAGINYFDKGFSRFSIYKKRPGLGNLSASVISSFAETPDGNLWIGTDGGGLNFLNRATGKFHSFKQKRDNPDSLSANNIKTLLADGDRLWIGTYQFGLNLFDPETNTFEHFRHQPDNPNSLLGDNVYSLLREGDYLWIASYEGGLNRMNIKTRSISRYTHNPGDSLSLSSNSTRVIFKDREDDLWIGTEAGINLLKGRKEGKIYFKTFLPKVQVYAIQAADEESIWIGTYSHGLFHLNKHTHEITNYNKTHGLPGNAVFGILDDDFGNLWLSTNNGLVKFNKEESRFSSYDHNNELKGLEFNFNAHYKTRKGEFLFGSTAGFTLFHPRDIQSNTFHPPVVFTDLYANNKLVKVQDKEGILTRPINQTEQITFSHKEANFTLHFSSLDYTNPQSNHYSYKMEGVDQEWKFVSGQSSATYTLQNEGTYTFLLKGSNNDGIWNPKVRKLKIIVRPPIWRSWWAYFGYVCLFATLLYAIIRYTRLQHSFQLEQISKQKQEELHQMKLRFYTNLTHELRTPLTLILGPLQEMIQIQEGGGELQKRLKSIERNALRLLNLVNQLLNFRKLESGFSQMKVAQGNIVNFLKEIFLSFKETARLREIDYTFDSEETELNLWYDRDKLEKVFFNILSNAFKFTHNMGEIAIRIENKKDTIEILIEDNGQGIDPLLTTQIFDRYYEDNSDSQFNSEGTGIGLALSIELVNLHHGTIKVESTGKDGSTFIISLPKGKAHFKSQDFLEDFRNSEDISHYQHPLQKSKSNQAKPSFETTLPKQERPQLLLVEDNPEIREYISHLLEETYQIFLAEDGIEGLEKAIKLQPDLIISDIMMPKMDGINLCSELKTSIETSHIPIILLTARSSVIFRIEGLETGADDYLSKPFNPQELKLKVRNLISLRKKIREKYAQVRNFDPKEISVTSADERFLIKLQEVAEKHIENIDFSMEEFAYELAVSRPILFSKVKALTNQTPNNFLKIMRLKRAKQLLESDKLNISDIAYLVGFRDARYFSKCFQKEYGLTPTEYLKQLNIH